jgi:hypothetical protein
MRFLIAFCLLLLALPAMAETTITYQGQLQDGGEPFSGTVGMSFVLHEHDTDHLPIGPTISLNQVAVSDGLFTVELDFGEVFTGQPLWLEASVDSTPLTPRQRITAVPMALNVPAGAGSNWQRVNDDIYFDGGNIGIGTSEPLFPLQVITDQPFDPESSDTVVGALISVTGPGTLGGLQVSAFRSESTENPAYAIVGTTNTSLGASLRGLAQAPSGPAIAVQGETYSSEGFAGHFIGHEDSRNYFQRRVGIGLEDPDAMLQVVGSSITGHFNNQATGLNSFVSGGRSVNDNPNPNSAIGDGSFVGGGNGNSATSRDTFVGGGRHNTASGALSFVGGGANNTASGLYSFVAGGRYNSATGYYSMAAGLHANAIHNGTFVWADDTQQAFESTENNQFLIRAGGGVGIGTNEPDSQLHVNALVGEDPLRAQIDGQTAFSVSSNGGVAIGGFTILTPVNGLYVAGRTGLGTAIPERDLHIKQSSTNNGNIGLQIERSGNTNNWAFYIATSDNLGFRYNDDLVARIDTTGQFATLSDARHKTDIGPVKNPLERLLALEPSQYRMKSGSADDAPSLGLIAQQVREIIPAAVSDTEDTLGIHYNQITALNSAAIIELHASMANDRNQMTRLQAENEALRQRLAQRSTRDVEIKAVAERNQELEQRLQVLEALLIGETRVSKNTESTTRR